MAARLLKLFLGGSIFFFADIQRKKGCSLQKKKLTSRSAVGKPRREFQKKIVQLFLK